ncbi:uncharacterized protein LOC107870446 [Capsicum annuum]|uniref:uncharacterized protein LOC107870446 n=1 Tax=Capsicum annuum TaxID=4072 RepID=UPI001FB12A0F|nr:uncharacterized protein LOC107870446 [Capsicum annuum]
MSLDGRDYRQAACQTPTVPSPPSVSVNQLSHHRRTNPLSHRSCSTMHPPPRHLFHSFSSLIRPNCNKTLLPPRRCLLRPSVVGKLIKNPSQERNANFLFWAMLDQLLS